MIRVGVVGAGTIGKDHLAAFTAAAGAEVVAVADPAEGVARRTAQQFDVARHFERPEELLLLRGLDAVVVAVPNRFHEPLGVLALEAGKHVLLEKPMAIDLAGAQAIHDAALSAGKVLMLGHQWRRVWWMEAMRERVQAGALGKIYHAKCRWMRRKGIPGWGSWFTRKEWSGGGPLVDIAVHLLDLAFEWLGNPRPLAASGATYAAFGPQRRGIGAWGTPDWNGFFDVEDLATALVRCEGGAVISLDVSWAAHTDRNCVVFEVLGEKGGLVFDGEHLKFLSERDDETVDETIAMPSGADEEKDPGRAAMTAEFLRCIEAGDQPLASAASGLANMKVLDAIYRSAQSGAEVAID